MSEGIAKNNKDYNVNRLWLSWCLSPEEMKITIETDKWNDEVVKSPWDNDSLILGSTNLTCLLAKKDEQLKEANAVIDGVSSYYDLYSDAWSGQEYEFLRLAEEYKEKWGL